MKQNDSVTKGTIQIVINILSIVLLILNVICFFKLMNCDYSLLTLCTIFNIIDLLLNGGKGFVVLIPLGIFNFIYHKDLWLAIKLSLLYEQILVCIFMIAVVPLGIIGMARNK